VEKPPKSTRTTLEEVRAFVKSTQSNLKRARGLNDEVRASLQAKLNEARSRQKTIIMRTRATESRKTVTDRLYSADIDRAIARFDQFEKKIEVMESEIEANGIGRNASSIEAEFARLEKDGKVDEELAALKAKLESRNRGSGI